eukprot:50439-Rhodomonas_salina.1
MALHPLARIRTRIPDFFNPNPPTSRFIPEAASRSSKYTRAPPRSFKVSLRHIPQVGGEREERVDVIEIPLQVLHEPPDPTPSTPNQTQELLGQTAPKLWL